jgi:hypothetical protein
MTRMLHSPVSDNAKSANKGIPQQSLSYQICHFHEKCLLRELLKRWDYKRQLSTKIALTWKHFIHSMSNWIPSSNSGYATGRWADMNFPLYVEHMFFVQRMYKHRINTQHVGVLTERVKFKLNILKTHIIGSSTVII